MTNHSRNEMVPGLRVWPARACVSVVIFALTWVYGIAPVRADDQDLRRSAIVRAVEAALPSVVSIEGERKSVEEGYDTPSLRRGMGTGFVIDPHGYIMTNHHVVDGVREIRVRPYVADGSRGQEYVAEFLCKDEETDLAIIKIDPEEPLPVMTIGTSSDLMVGEDVIAIGNAYGYSHSVTRGIISALHRGVEVNNVQEYADAIQVDASINPGNSGGPLLNVTGEMIGINVAVRAGAQCIAFAIPIDKAMDVAARLLRREVASRFWHGLIVREREVAGQRRLVVETTEFNGPAEVAGVDEDDVIEAVNDVPVVRELDFYRALLACSEKGQIELSLRRGDEVVPATIVLDAAETEPDDVDYAATAWEALGVRLRGMEPSAFQSEAKDLPYGGGLRVTAVRPESPAAKNHIEAGDILVGLHVWETRTLAEVNWVISHVTDTPSVNFIIVREGEHLWGKISLANHDSRVAAH